MVAYVLFVRDHFKLILGEISPYYTLLPSWTYVWIESFGHSLCLIFFYGTDKGARAAGVCEWQNFRIYSQTPEKKFHLF